MLVKEWNNQVKVTWRIPSELFKELKHKAIDDNVPVTDLVVKALSDFLKRSSKK
jgi:hypothetical protein